MAWAKNGTPSTLTGTADTLTISDLTAKTFNVFLCHTLPSGTVNNAFRIGNGTVDSGSNYAFRYNDLGAGDYAATSQTEMVIAQDASSDTRFIVFYMVNIAAQEKLGINFSVNSNTAGAGNAPFRTERVWKWANTSVQFNIAQTYNTNAGDFNTGSNLSAIESEGTPVAVNIQNGTVFEETDTNKSYIFNSSTSTWTQF